MLLPTRGGHDVKQRKGHVYRVSSVRLEGHLDNTHARTSARTHTQVRLVFLVHHQRQIVVIQQSVKVQKRKHCEMKRTFVSC